MSMVPIATITIATGQNMSVATMIYPLIAIVTFCTSVNNNNDNENTVLL
jgi:hypothetical protein